MSNKKIVRNSFAHSIKLIMGLASIIVLVFCSAQIVLAIQYNAITVSKTNGEITVNDNQFNGLTISPSLVFNKVGDSITYEIPLSSPDGTEYQVKNVSDDNTNPYITTSYSYDDKMNAEDKSIYATLTYSQNLPFGTELNLNDIHASIQINENDPTPSPIDGNTQPNDNSSNSIDIPNTGANSAKYLAAHSSIQTNNTLPYLIVGFLSILVIIDVFAPKKHRMKFGTAILIIAIATPTLVLPNYTHAKTTSSTLTILASNISAVPNIDNPKDVVSVSFPNIYNNKVQDRAGEAPGNAIILKTLDNKYVLMDTGPSTPNIREVIYDKFTNLQNSSNITIDYLVISHLDSDHRGNAVSFINDENYTIKNIVLKHEIYENGSQESAFKSITQAAAAHNVNIITSGDSTTQNYMATLGLTNYDKISEGMVINVGNYLKLDFFNTANVYDGKPCQTGLKLDWTASTTASNLYQTSDGKYVYFDGSEYRTKTNGDYNIASSKYPYSDITLKTTTTPVAKEGGSGMNRYFYAVNAGSHNICVSNPNSFGILAEVTTTNLNRYMYFTGDIENAGYSTLSSGANSAQLFENLTYKNGEFKTNTTPYAIPSEDNTATAIYNKLAADATSHNLSVDQLLNNIVIYQESHHGGNNSEKALWKLNLNRDSGIYAIEEGSTNMATNASFRMAKTYWYTLSNLPAENKLRVGTPTWDGVNCTINMLGATVCNSY